jgi:hypothetical protein
MLNIFSMLHAFRRPTVSHLISHLLQSWPVPRFILSFYFQLQLEASDRATALSSKPIKETAIRSTYVFSARRFVKPQCTSVKDSSCPREWRRKCFAAKYVCSMLPPSPSYQAYRARQPPTFPSRQNLPNWLGTEKGDTPG